MVYELVRSINRGLFEVHVICYNGHADTVELEERIEQCVDNVTYLESKGGIARRREVFRVLKTFRPDLVHAHLGGYQMGLPWCILSHTPLLLTMHTTLPLAINRRLVPLTPLLCSRFNVHLVAVSSDNKDQANEFFNNKISNIDYINNGITLSDYGRPVQSDYPVYINVGTQNNNKNQSIIIKAFSEVRKNIPEARLILVGDGPNHQSLIVLAREFPGIELPGSSREVSTWLSRANVYVQSSFREAMPMAILEAMATGLPVISTDVGGIRTMIDESSGMFVTPGSCDELVSSMVKLADPRLRREMGDKAKEKALAFSADAMAASYEGLYAKYAR